MKKIICVLVFVLSICIYYADYIPVEIVNNAEDEVGKRLVSKVREEIRKSQAYKLEYDSNQPRFILKISAMDRYKGDASYEGISTIYNYTILIALDSGLSLYCYDQLGYCGSKAVDEVAYSIYSDLDEFCELLKKIITNK